MAGGSRLTSREWWSLFDANYEAAKQRYLVAHDGHALVMTLVDAERWTVLAAITTTQYIQRQRDHNATPTRTRSEAEVMQLYRPGSKPAAPVPPRETTSVRPSPGPEPVDRTAGGPWIDCPECGNRKPWRSQKDPWPGAICLDCYREQVSG